MRSLARSATHESSRVRRRLPTLQALLACLGAALLSQAESAEPVERDPAEKNEAHQAERPAPLASPDPFAGKTVRSRQMAMDLILHRLGNAPRVGQFFPDFELPRTDGEGTVRLSEEAAKAPVVLLFGSATCDELSANLDGIQKLWKAHGHAYRFLFVYGREAHPSDGWLAEGRQTFPDPKSLRERLQSAKECSPLFPFPVLVDRLDDSVFVRWAAWPSRAFVLDQDGRVIYCGGQAPFDYFITEDRRHPVRWEASKPPFSEESLERFLERHSDGVPPRPSPTP